MSRSRAQSSVIGVVILTGVVILSISAIGVFWIGSITDQADASGPLVDADVNVTDEQVRVDHVMGESVDVDDLEVILRNGSATERYRFDVANVSGDDGTFDPADTFQRRHGLGNGTFEVLVVHLASNTVIHSERLDVRSDGDDEDTGRDPTAKFTVSPDDPEPGETLTFDASGSSDPDGSISTYEWTFGDGSTASREVVDHSYGGSGDYDVTLTVTDDEGNTATASRTIEVDNLRAPDDPENPVEGISYQYYEADDEYASMPDFGAETPTRTGVTDQFDLDPDRREENFAFRFTGYVEVPEDGEYTFSTRSDDGSELFIGDELVVDNGGLHSNRTRSGTIGLEAGRHEITVTYFEHTVNDGLSVSWSGPGVTSGTVPPSALFRTDAPIAVLASDCSGPECTFDAGGSSNPGGSIAGYEWDFGDGTTATGPTASHTYDSAGQYTVNLTATGDGGGTDSEQRTVDVTPYQPALSPGPVTQGVDYEYFEASGQYAELSDVDWSEPTRTGTTDRIDLGFTPEPRDDDFAVSYRTYLQVPENDTYTFYTSSDDGSVLSVDGTEVVDNRGEHAEQEASGEIALEAGYHTVTVRYFERAGATALSASYEATNVSKQELPAGRLYRSQPTARWETAGDWDAAPAEDGVVHESYGDRNAGVIELGYPTGGQWGPTGIAYWPLDEDSGSTVADVIGSNDGTVQGASIDEEGTLGTTAYSFDAGNEEYVDGATDLDALRGTATLSVWVDTTVTGTDTMWQSPGITGVESDGDGDDVFWGWIDENGRIGVQAGNAPGATSTTPIDDGSWHHVVMTRDQDSGEVEVYVDGTLEDSATSRDGTIGTTFSSIGRIEDTATSPEYFDGHLEDLIVYDGVLTASEVTSLHDAATEGSLTTGTKTLSEAVAPRSLSLRNVSVGLPAGSSTSVTVRSDPDGDGTMEETSDAIELQPGTTSHSVTGLSSESSRFALEIELSSTDPSVTPSVDRIELAG